MATIVLGAQWGDEGKGKLVDILCSTTALCCRAQGGNNAGHTIVANNTHYDFHILPSGLINPACHNLIGSGVVIHIPSFFAELAALEEKGMRGAQHRVKISDRAHVVFDLHQRIDALEESALGKGKIGTTGKGIGPAYSTKAARSGVRVAEVLREGILEERLRSLERATRARWGDQLVYDVEEEIQRFKTYRTLLPPFITDAISFLASYQSRSLPILIEGANALMLDLDHGTYPYVTSSNTGLGGVFTGLALDPARISSVIGVVKAYTTRVGAGPFPTEQLSEAGEQLQTIGREFGVTTGRKRRCGWLDLVVVKYSAAVNHYTHLNVTKLDVLDGFAEVRVAVKYLVPKAAILTNGAAAPNGTSATPGEEGEDEGMEVGADGVLRRALPSFPADLALLRDVTVGYKSFPGWMASTRGATTWSELPARARDYVSFIEEFVGVPVRYVGTGPDRKDMIVR
ncbi:MAG: hypothetical protein M1829_003105 [Trizodia sp. TS-e1964]|nr:MAG: hypothetical protein M1829_003105 [Trizodia sp. TS-e1964]